MLRRWFLRPSLWTCLVSIVAYWDRTALHGAFVYDDAGSVKRNVVVTGQVPLREGLLTRDYWGNPMTEARSHKSFRPITTLTFRLNWMLSERLGTNETEEDHTFGFHLCNVGLHGVVTGLVTEASSFVFYQGTVGDSIAQLVTGFLFGLHPVHAEAVSNITSRGELLMSVFFLIAFLSYARHAVMPLIEREGQQQSTLRKLTTFVGVYIIPWLCMTLSMFSKEQGATTLISLVFFDFLHNHGNVSKYFHDLLITKDPGAARFLVRTIVLALQTIVVCLWRYFLNGESSPDFIFDQNPAGFSEDRFTRMFSVTWVYCLYVRDMLVPVWLCPDWSGVSIRLIESWQDPRSLLVLILWIVVCGLVYSLFHGLPNDASLPQQQHRTVILEAFFAFTASPFLLSSNILVVVGLMKADRVIYLPLFGFCLLEAHLFKTFCITPAKELSQELASIVKRKEYWLGHVLLVAQLGLFASKVHERNIAWSDSLNLWMRAYQINSVSRHTTYNCGYELSLRQRYEEAERVLRPIGNPRVEGPSNTFVYAMVLQNLDRCDEAHAFIDEAMDVVEEKRQKSDRRRDTEASLVRIESNLLVARSFCTRDNLSEAGKIMYSAVEKDPTNDYAIQQATLMMKQVKRIQALEQHKSNLGLV